MPSIKEGEKKSAYISRCVSYVVDKEGLDSEAALGKCFGLWKQHLKNKRAKGELLTEKEKLDLKNIEEDELTQIVGKI